MHGCVIAAQGSSSRAASFIATPAAAHGLPLTPSKHVARADPLHAVCSTAIAPFLQTRATRAPHAPLAGYLRSSPAGSWANNYWVYSAIHVHKLDRNTLDMRVTIPVSKQARQDSG